MFILYYNIYFLAAHGDPYVFDKFSIFTSKLCTLKIQHENFAFVSKEPSNGPLKRKGLGLERG